MKKIIILLAEVPSPSLIVNRMKQHKLFLVVLLILFCIGILSTCSPPPPSKPVRSKVIRGDQVPYVPPYVNPQKKVPYLGPLVEVTAVSFNFGYAPLSSSSVTKTYYVSGTRLKNDIVISAPPGFTFKVYPTTIGVNPLKPVSGNVALTRVDIEFNPTEPKTYTGNITNSSPGAPTRNIALNGYSCANVFFDAVGDLIGDCYISYCNDISRDGERVVLSSYSKDPMLPASGGACETTSSHFGYSHPYQAGGWTSPCKNIKFFPSSSTSGLIGFGYVTGIGNHLETTAFGVSPDAGVVVGYTSYGIGKPDSTKGTIISASGISLLGFLPGDFESVAHDVSETSPLKGPPGIPPGTTRRVVVGYSYTGTEEPSLEAGAHAVYWDNLNNSSPNVIHKLPLPDVLSNGQQVVSSEALSVSDDGTVIGGNLYYSQKSNGLHFNAVPCIWRLGSSVTDIVCEVLEDLDNTTINARVFHVSGDGKWAVGFSTPASGAYMACKWKINIPGVHNAEALPSLSGAVQSYAAGVNQDGTVIVGNNGAPIKNSSGEDDYASYATVWKSATIGGIMNVYDIEQILGSKGISLPPGWSLIQASRVSANGKIVTGYASRPNPLVSVPPDDPEYYTEEGWVIGLPEF